MGGSQELRAWIEYFSQFKNDDDEIQELLVPISSQYKIDYIVYQLAGDSIQSEEWIWNNVTYEQVLKRGLLARYKTAIMEQESKLRKMRMPNA